MSTVVYYMNYTSAGLRMAVHIFQNFTCNEEEAGFDINERQVVSEIVSPLGHV